MDIEGVLAISLLFLGLPWLCFHYITQWKRAGSLSIEDEKLLDDLHETARRLDDRLRSIERIMAADGVTLPPPSPAPEWRPGDSR